MPYREAYKATDVRNKQVLSGLDIAKAQLRQMLQDVSIADPLQGQDTALMMESRAGPGWCLDLSTHKTWATASPLVRPSRPLLLARLRPPHRYHLPGYTGSVCGA